MARPLFSVFLCVADTKKNGKKRSGHARLGSEVTRDLAAGRVGTGPCKHLTCGRCQQAHWVATIIGASLSEPHTSESFVGSSFYEYMR